jgi:hypothetical protein
MKKQFCTILALILMAALSLTALAEAAQPTASPEPEITAGDSAADGAIQPDASDSTADEAIQPDASDGGTFAPTATPGPDRAVDVDGQYTFTCPGALIAMNIEQQDMDNGLLFSASSDTMGVDVYKYEQGEDTLQSIYEAFKADDSLQEVTLADIFGVKALVYRIDETSINVTIAGDTGYLYDIMINYQTPEEYQMVGTLIASIKKAGAVG